MMSNWKNSKERADLIEPLFIIGFVFTLWLISLIISNFI